MIPVATLITVVGEVEIASNEVESYLSSLLVIVAASLPDVTSSELVVWKDSPSRSV